MQLNDGTEIIFIKKPAWGNEKPSYAIKIKSLNGILTWIRLTEEQFKEFIDEMKMIMGEEEKNLISEYGGIFSCFTSDGRIVNCADELNRLEREKRMKKEKNVCFTCGSARLKPCTRASNVPIIECLDCHDEFLDET